MMSNHQFSRGRRHGSRASQLLLGLMVVALLLNFGGMLYFIIDRSVQREINTGIHSAPLRERVQRSVDGQNVPYTQTTNGTAAGNHTGKDHTAAHPIRVASWRLYYVKIPLTICISLILVALIKLAFHHAELLSSHIPESCVLIIFGAVLGALIHHTGHGSTIHLHPQTFMLFLLPPIVLDSSYSLHDRVFFNNIGTILLFAVVGTLINCFCIGPTLYGLAQSGAMGSITITMMQCFVFSSLIIAVDPVAVLAIFQEVHVNEVLYFLVFGESLLNDAVTVVLYNMMQSFNGMPVIPASQIGMGIASFFTISLGGLTIGIIYGIVTALITKRTTHVKLVEPMIMLIMAYSSYLTAELFHWSGIISMIGCGLVQAQYAFPNISRKSSTTVKYFVKMLSACCDCIIFLFLGLELVRWRHWWHTGFVLWTLVACLVYRLFSVALLSYFSNRVNKVRPILLEEKFIMWYGGLRGAVSFALCATLDEKAVPMKHMFLTTTMFVIMFTVFIQGITIKPLVKLCKIRQQKDAPSTIGEKLTKHVMDHVTSGVEILTDHLGHNTLREWLVEINNKYIIRWLQRDPMTQDERLLLAYEKMMLEDHYQNVSNFRTENGKPTHDSAQKHRPPFTNIAEHSDESVDIMKPKPEPVGPTAAPTTSVLRVASLKTRMRKWRLAASRNREIGKDPTMADINMLLETGGLGSNALHRKYDRNLSYEGQTDLGSQLYEKHKRFRRYRDSHRPDGSTDGLQVASAGALGAVAAALMAGSKAARDPEQQPQKSKEEDPSASCHMPLLQAANGEQPRSENTQEDTTVV